MGNEGKNGKVPLISKIAYDILYRCVWNQYGGCFSIDVIFKILGCD